MARLQECPCGSGEFPTALYDARNIFCCYVCNGCEVEKKSHYRPEIFESLYDAEEPIEDD